MADSRDGAENILDELGAFHSARKQGRAQKKKLIPVCQRNTGANICPKGQSGTIWVTK